jgi:hypothetical protein
MDILQKIQEAIGEEEVDDVDISNDEYIFQRMADFILDIDPETLSIEELDKALEILDEFERIAEDEKVEEDITPIVSRLSNRSGDMKRSYARKWYRIKKDKIKKSKERFLRSSEGKKRSKSKDRLALAGRTPTNKDKVKYNVSHKTEEK